ncbi:MAG: GTPase RsgA [Oscillospiraceae bacterium]
MIIASAALPVTDPYLIDRISAIAALKDCRVLLCLNKCDLDPAEELYGIYSGSAIRVLRVSAVTGQGIDELRRELAGKLSAFTGNSGVGKSSILNALDPRFFPGGGGGQQGPGPGTAHHPPCGAVLPGTGHLCHRHPGLCVL